MPKINGIYFKLFSFKVFSPFLFVFLGHSIPDNVPHVAKSEATKGSEAYTRCCKLAGPKPIGIRVITTDGCILLDYDS